MSPPPVCNINTALSSHISMLSYLHCTRYTVIISIIIIVVMVSVFAEFQINVSVSAKAVFTVWLVEQCE